ncbi:TrfB-related DNA-binding protein [Pseudomonas gingeri]
MTHGKTADQDLRIPPDAFERIRNDPASRMQSKSFQVAFEILVEGKKLSAVASHHGVTKQRALAIRDKVYAAYLLQAPEGWKYVQICAPEDMVDRFVNEVAVMRVRYWQERAAVKKVE